MRNIQKVVSGLPHFAKGEIIKGFGRGSKELGNITKNLEIGIFFLN
jgi:FAD synthase